jgi:hypothetical protein
MRPSPEAKVAAEKLKGALIITILIYVDTNKPVADKNHLKGFANQDAAVTWFQENDPEGVAFEYKVLE